MPQGVTYRLYLNYNLRHDRHVVHRLLSPFLATLLPDLLLVNGNLEGLPGFTITSSQNLAQICSGSPNLLQRVAIIATNEDQGLHSRQKPSSKLGAASVGIEVC